MDDIVPELLKAIQSQFEEKIRNSPKIRKALQQLKNKKATYIDVNDFAIESGEILADALGTNITTAFLPDGKMYFNIAERILNPTMKNNFELVSGFASEVQTELNQAVGLRLRSQTPTLNQDRIDGIINRVSSEDDFDTVKWILQEPIINFTQSVVDDAIKANVDFHAKSGLEPTITRTVRGKACDWCKNLAGTYLYHEAPDDVYRRHDRCQCMVEFNPKDSRGIQNSHSKKWRDPRKDAKIEMRRNLGSQQNEMMRRKVNLFGIEPMPKRELQKIVKDFRRNGGIIQMDEVTESYLKKKGAEAINYDGGTILFPRRPGRASVYEELFHAAQYREGKNDGSQLAVLTCEIEAQEYLLKNAKMLKLTDREISDTASNLKMYQEKLKQLERG